MSENELEGTVVWFNDKLGYGFIAVPDEEGDYFVHYSQIKTKDKYKSLSAGEKVWFTSITVSAGKQAQNVRRYEDGRGTASPTDKE